MTFNIRYDDDDDGPHAWRHRRDLVLDVIRSHDPDLLGLQEPTIEQWHTIAAALPGHSIFPAAGDPAGDGERHGGFFRTARFESLDSGLFWLADTAAANGPSSPTGSGPRACRWVKLRDRAADRNLLFACTHFDTSAEAWVPSAKALHAECDRLAGAWPIVLAGDFNCAARSDAYRYLRDDAGYRDTWTEAGHSDDGVLTFNGFTRVTRLPGDVRKLQRWLNRTSAPLDTFGHYPRHVQAHGNYRIDWILLRGPIVAVSAMIDVRGREATLPSDHYPVVARIEYAAAPR
jgi:endonuclease/exonuclease/phosphatase family metal-dependent hydrolase